MYVSCLIFNHKVYKGLYVYVEDVRPQLFFLNFLSREAEEGRRCNRRTHLPFGGLKLAIFNGIAGHLFKTVRYHLFGNRTFFYINVLYICALIILSLTDKNFSIYSFAVFFTISSFFSCLKISILNKYAFKDVGSTSTNLSI